jgi:DNA polymerase III sliding clamp (beta) subunit (PCNA family)
MASQVVFETATLVDAIAKAARIAPKKGEALDMSAGIVINVEQDNCWIASTDLQSTFRQKLHAIKVENAAVWRVPSQLFSGFCSALPLGSGSQTTIIDKGDSFLYVKCGKAAAKFIQIPTESYPWELVAEFDPTPLVHAPGLAARLSSVSWAADRGKTGSVLSGVHISGDHLVATDSYKMAVIECKVPVAEPVTSPLTDLSALIKNAGQVSVASNGAGRLLLVTDQDTQATSILFADQKYPNYNNMLSLAAGLPFTISFQKSELENALSRLLAMVSGEDYPRVSLKFNAGDIEIRTNIEGVGETFDSISCERVAGSDPWVSPSVELAVNPHFVMNAIAATRDPILELKYATGSKPIAIFGSDGYCCVIMSIKS